MYVYNKGIIFAASSRKRLRGCLLSAVELECDKNGGLREVGAEAIFQEVADLALPLVDLGSLGRDSLEKSLQVNILEKLKNLATHFIYRGLSTVFVQLVILLYSLYNPLQNQRVP